MHPLDNVIWTALTTRQAVFAESTGEACRFVPEVSPLAAFREPTARGYESLAELLPEDGMIGLFLKAPYESRAGWKFVAGAPLVQLVYQNGESISNFKKTPNPLIELGDADSAEMVELTGLTKPGPFGRRTHELGTYLGIRREGKLVAMAGERLKVPGYTEVSAVCSHPEHTGQGYARELMTEVMGCILARGETPFLHVRQDNIRAIALYEKLGFKVRLQGHFAVLRKQSVLSETV